MGKTVKKAEVKNTKSPKIAYLKTDADDLDLIITLWNKLRLHHQERSSHFKNDFYTYIWEARKKSLREKAEDGVMLVELAKDNGTNQLIGYCVSSIDDGKQGEIELIY
jgi:diamine N-acetyltransferase